MNSPDRLLHRAMLGKQLLERGCTASFAADPNRPLLAGMLAGRLVGLGCLPGDLGLGLARCQGMLDACFAGLVAKPEALGAVALPEWEDLQKLLLDHRAGKRESELWMADIVATACAGCDHLWQDLGLGNRDELSLLMRINFPALAAANTGDMKWKKFLYRQFCAAEGVYVCPAPSCSQCVDYARCFAPEC